MNEQTLEDALQARIAALEAALVEIRDLARTGLPPDCIDEQYWRQHKLNQISGEADYALRKGEVKE